MKKPTPPRSQKSAIRAPSGSSEGDEEFYRQFTFKRQRKRSRWGGDGEEPLFYQNGATWYLSERLSELRIQLQLGGKSYPVVETSAASRAFSNAVVTSEMGQNGKSDAHQAEEEESAYDSFVLPFAWRMRKAKLATPEEADKIKQRAFLWLSQVIDLAFRKTPPIKRDNHRANLLIGIAHDLCKSLGRLPKKKEVWDEARKRNAQLFTVGEDIERTMLKKAGLDSLPQARKGGK